RIAQLHDALDAVLDVAFERPEDADDQFQRQDFGAAGIFAEAIFVDAAKGPDGGHRRPAFDEAAVRPLAADADALRYLDALAIREPNFAVLRHAGAKQVARAADMIDRFAALLGARDIVLVFVAG